MELNPLLEIYAVRQNLQLRNEMFLDALMESQNGFRDLVFICRDKQVSFHSTMVSTLSPVIRNFVAASKTYECSSYVKDQTELFISLDNISSASVELVFSSFYRCQPLMLSSTQIIEVRSLFLMLGINQESFTITNQSFNPQRVTIQGRKRKYEDVSMHSRSAIDYSSSIDSDEFVENYQKEQLSKYQHTPVQQSNSGPNAFLTSRTLNLPPSISIVSTPNVSEQAKSKQSEKPTFKEATESRIQNILPHLTVTSVNQNVESHHNSRVALHENQSSVNQNVESYHNSRVSIHEDQTLVNQNVESYHEAREPDLENQSIIPYQEQNIEGLNVNTVTPNFDDKPDFSEHDNQQYIPEKYSMDYANDVSTEMSDQLQGLKCPVSYCTHNGIFRVRSHLIMHITHEHYKEQILESYPWNRGGSCQICVEQQSSKIYSSNNRKSYIMHIGVTHEAVMELLPPNVKDALDAIGARKKRKVTKSIHENGDSQSRGFLESGDVSFGTNYSSGSDACSVSKTDYENYDYQEQSYGDESVYRTPQELVPEENQYNNFEQIKGGSIDQKVEYESKAEMLPDHLSTPCVNQIKEEVSVKNEVLYTCYLCTNRSFPNRDDLLFHLTFTHFSKDLLCRFPFIEAAECTRCTDKPIISTNRSTHLRHVGVFHREVLAFLPQSEVTKLESLESYRVPPTEVNSFNDTTITTAVKTEPEENELPSESKCIPMIEQIKEEATTIKCPMCPTRVREYVKRSEFLKHLSLGHYGRNILQSHPFEEKISCSMCQDKVFIPTKKEIHVCHVGVLHGKVFDYLTEEILVMVKSLPTMKKISTDGSAKPLMELSMSSSDNSFSKPEAHSIEANPTVLDATLQEEAPPVSA